MAELSVNPAADFSFGRLFADAGRVLARGWPVLVVGVLVLGVAPRVAIGLPWWRADITTPETQRIAVEVTLLKAAISLVFSSAMSAFVAAVSLKVLQDGAWQDTLAPAPLALGAATALCVSLLLSWPSLITPLVGRWLSPPQVTALALSVVFLELVLLPFVGVATSAAIAERRFVPAAFARSVRLLRGLRWRLVALAFGFVAAMAVTQVLVGMGLVVGGPTLTRGPGPARIVLTLSGAVVGVLAAVTFASVFIQSRRLADGPTETELVEVFA
jgi:hypothetical protein